MRSRQRNMDSQPERFAVRDLRDLAFLSADCGSTLDFLTSDAARLTSAVNEAISTAASAASKPLFPIFNPARSMACSRLSQVRTPNA